jgi:hypothetical protein
VTVELTDDGRRILWEQYVDTYVDSQETYDSSVRTLAAGGLRSPFRSRPLLGNSTGPAY